MLDGSRRSACVHGRQFDLAGRVAGWLRVGVAEHFLARAEGDRLVFAGAVSVRRLARCLPRIDGFIAEHSVRRVRPAPVKRCGQDRVSGVGGYQAVEVPNPATTGLHGVAAVSTDDVWAVGGAQILHWDGSAWSVVPSPQGDYYLQSAAAVSAIDVWAVGYQEVASGEGYYDDPLVEHWDGSSWSVVGSATGGAQGYLFGVTAQSPTSVWAVGDLDGLSFAEKWDGTQWARVPSGNVGTSNNTFQAVAAKSGTVWAVGEWYQAASPYQAQTLTERCPACS